VWKNLKSDQNFVTIVRAPITQVDTIGMFRRCDVSQFPISVKNRLCNIAQSARDTQILREGGSVLVLRNDQFFVIYHSGFLYLRRDLSYPTDGRSLNF